MPRSPQPGRTAARRAAACLFAGAAACAAPSALAAPPLRAAGRHFVDEAGAVVILRGVNVAGNSKVPPFTPASDPEIFAPLRGWGLNVVRLLFTWEAYEPAPGEHDEGYLDYYAAAARAAHEHGLFVVVDFHQDAFSRFSVDGCGDGFPAWALPPEIAPDVPDNGAACSNWGVKMQSDEEMKAAWQAFHSDAHGVKTRYLAMLKRVSERLSGEPGVIGYDVMNEPWGDEATEIAALHEQAAAALREASPDAIVFVSPHARTSAGTPTDLPEPTFDNVAYAPHFYDASVILFESWSGVEPDAAFDTMSATAEAWDVPLFVGEFGAPAPTEDGPLYMDALYSRLNDRWASGAQWVYTPGWTPEKKDGWNDEDLSIVDDAGRLRENFRPRPYPARISGVPVAFRLAEGGAPGSRSIELEWEHDPGKGRTELFVAADAFFGPGVALGVETSSVDLLCALAGSWLRCQSPVPGPKRLHVHAAAPRSPACGLTGIELLPLALAALRRRRRVTSGRSPSASR